MSGNFSRRKARQKQTRLTFDPVDLTSSPGDLPPSVFSPARVVYKSYLSPSKPRSSQKSSQMSPVFGAGTRVMRDTSKKNGKISFPPSQATPSKKPSAKKIAAKIESSDSESSVDAAIRGSSRKKLHRSSQLRSSDLQTSPNFMARHKKGINQPSSPPPYAQALDDPSDDDEISNAELTGSQPSMNREFSIEIPLRRNGNVFQSKSTIDPENIAMPQSPPKSAQPLSDNEKTDTMLPPPKSMAPVAPMVTLDDESDSEEDVIAPIRSSQRQVRQIVPDDKENEDDIEDEDDIVLPTPGKRRRQEEDDEVDRNPSPAKRLHTRKSIEDVSDSDELPRRPVVPKKDKAVTQKEAKDKQKAELPSSQRTTRQQVVKRHRTEREKTMELLRRKRAGEKISKLTDSESEGEPQQGIYDSNSELEALSHFEDEEEQEAQALESVRQSIRGANRNNYEDDFIVEDDEIGAPGMGLHDIPLEFTRQAHKPLKEHFKDCIEWMVQKKINPGFNSSDPLYRNSFLKMSDEVRGLANSKFMSSIWTPDFALALQARPIFNEAELQSGESMIHMHCDACNRNHPTRFILQFTGNPYNIDTLEDIEKDEDSSDEEPEPVEERDHDIDSQGRLIPKAEKTWYVGRFCKANAETSHSLLHWKYALNTWVVDQLVAERYMRPKRLAERESWSVKKRGKEANRIVDSWEAGKQIRELYRDFKANLENARNASTTRTKTSRD